MTNYSDDLNIKPIFERIVVKNCLGEVLQIENKKQLKSAETLKSHHLTYFFNGLKEKSFEKEDVVIIESLKDYKKSPQMKAYEIADKLIAEIKRRYYDLIIVNFANADILAHTGDFESTIKGVEIVDEALGKIYQKVLEFKDNLIITSDHGNAESLTYPTTGERETKHNLNPVPLYLLIDGFKRSKTKKEIEEEELEIKGILADVAPTILELMNIEKPKEMSGVSLLEYLKL